MNTTKAEIRSFNDFVGLVDQTYNNNIRHLRYGQTLMIVLYDIWPTKYKEILSTDFDCFYDNSTVQFTLEKLEKEWEIE
jgi:hypothetical protein